MELLNGPKLVSDAHSFVTTEYSEPVDATGVSVLACEVVNDVSTPAAKAFASGTAAVKTITFPSVAGSTGGDYFVVYDPSGLAWAAALNKSGADPAPTGAIYAAIPAGRKVNVDISGGTDAASVAALVETAFDALTGATAAFVTDDTAANGTMLFTCVESGPVTAAEVHNADDSGAGSITQANTTTGVAGDINVANDLITEVAHGFLTGLKVQVATSSVLPGGIVAVTDYFVIKVSADTYKLASSLVDALAGTPLAITSIGTGNQTVTPTAIAGATATLQKSLGGGLAANWVWFDEGSSQNITVDGSLYFEKVNPSGNFYRIAFAITAGQLTSYERWLGKRIT